MNKVRMAMMAAAVCLSAAVVGGVAPSLGSTPMAEHTYCC